MTRPAEVKVREGLTQGTRFDARIPRHTRPWHAQHDTGGGPRAEKIRPGLLLSGPGLGALDGAGLCPGDEQVTVLDEADNVVARIDNLPGGSTVKVGKSTLRDQ